VLATCQPRISRPNVRSRHTFKKQIIASSYIAASNDLVPERWGLLSLDPLAGWISPFGSILSLCIRARPEHPRSVSDPLGWTILSPSEENATAKQGYERRSPIAYNLPLGACTPIHAFETCPTRTQPTSLKRGCSIIPQHRVSCRWSTPQKRLPRSSTIVSCRWSTPQRRLPRSLRSCPVGGLRTKAITKIIYRIALGRSRRRAQWPRTRHSDELFNELERSSQRKPVPADHRAVNRHQPWRCHH
jgi:hypothetical protein